VSQHFIEDIKIENFKCFENLEINDFKRVNVFGGKNNVGKTALLEAIELLVTSVDLSSLVHNTYDVLVRRQQKSKKLEVNLVGLLFNFFSIKSVSKNKEIQEEFSSNKILRSSIDTPAVFKFNGKRLGVSLRDFLSGDIYEKLSRNSSGVLVPSVFVESTLVFFEKIGFLYGSIVELDKEVFLNESLGLFDESIISLKVIPTEDEVTPKFKIKDRDGLVPLSEMGDGISRYVTILCAIWASQNGFLFIDEIENGIHYSNYKKLWELIFMASEQANCQVFVTSHSKECIEAFNNVQQERNDDAGRYFELYRSEKKQRIVAAVRDAEQLHYSLTHGAAIRGE